MAHATSDSMAKELRIVVVFGRFFCSGHDRKNNRQSRRGACHRLPSTGFWQHLFYWR